MYISADVQRITLNSSCVTISGERSKQLDIFCRVTGFTSDFLSFIDVELIRFFHGALQLFLVTALSGLVTLTFDLLTLKCNHWSPVSWASVKPIFSIGFGMRHTDDSHQRLMPPPCGGKGIIRSLLGVVLIYA